MGYVCPGLQGADLRVALGSARVRGGPLFLCKLDCLNPVNPVNPVYPLPPRAGEGRMGAGVHSRSHIAMSKDDLGLCNIEDLRQMAKKRLPRGIFEYIDGAAEDGIALQ